MAQYKIAEFSLVYKDIQNQGLRNEFIYDLRRNLINEIDKYDWNPEVTIVVDTIDGSIKGQLKFYALITMIALFLDKYGGIRDGIDHLVNDSKWVFSQIEREVNDRNRFEKRYLAKELNYGLVQDLSEIVNKIEYLESNYDIISPLKQRERLKELKQKISNILASLEFQDRTELIKELPESITRNLPEPNKKESIFLKNKYGLKEEDEPKIYRKR